MSQQAIEKIEQRFTELAKKPIKLFGTMAKSSWGLLNGLNKTIYT